MTPGRDISMMFSGYLLFLRCCLKFKSPTSNVSFEELALRNLIASPLMKPLRLVVSLGRLEMGFGVQDGNFCESFSIWFSDISAMNLIVRWN